MIQQCTFETFNHYSKFNEGFLATPQLLKTI